MANPLPFNKTFIFSWLNLYRLAKHLYIFWLNLFFCSKYQLHWQKKYLFMAKILSFSKTFCLLAKLLSFLNKPLPFDKTFFSISYTFILTKSSHECLHFEQPISTTNL
jgi:hypothetical protein